jgi:hypothetical protein
MLVRLQALEGATVATATLTGESVALLEVISTRQLRRDVTPPPYVSRLRCGMVGCAGGVWHELLQLGSVAVRYPVKCTQYLVVSQSSGAGHVCLLPWQLPGQAHMKMVGVEPHQLPADLLAALQQDMASRQAVPVVFYV